jgi:hypothetical protein
LRAFFGIGSKAIATDSEDSMKMNWLAFVAAIIGLYLVTAYALTNKGPKVRVVVQDMSRPAMSTCQQPRPTFHPAVAAGIVDFLETAEAVGVAAEAYENPDGDGVGYQVDVPLGHVYEEAQPNFVLSP